MVLEADRFSWGDGELRVLNSEPVEEATCGPDCACEPCQAKRMPLLETPGLIDVPDSRQSENWSCGSAVVSAVAQHFGVEPDTETEAVLALGSSPRDGTDPEHLVSVLQGAGLETTALAGMDLDDVQYFLSKGRPIVVAMQAWGTPEEDARLESGHYVVLLGIDAESVIVMDPARFSPDELTGYGESRGGQRVAIPRAEFLRRWIDTDAEGNTYERYGVAARGPALLEAKGTCKPGETAKATGCVPASGDAPAPKDKGGEDNLDQGARRSGPHRGFTSDDDIAQHATKMLEAHEANPQVQRLRATQRQLRASADKIREDAYMLPEKADRDAKAAEWAELQPQIEKGEELLRHAARRSFTRSYRVDHAEQPSFRGVPAGARIDKGRADSWEQAKNFLQEVSHREGIGDQSVKLSHTKDGRAFYERGTLHTAKGDGPEVTAHEFGHHLEENPGVRARVQAFSKDRFGAEPYTDMAEVAKQHGFRSGAEAGRQDDLAKLFGSESSAYYAGKSYPDGRSELLSMGLEQLYRDPIHFAKTDPKYFGLVVGILQRKA